MTSICLKFIPDEDEFLFVELDFPHVLSGDTTALHGYERHEQDNARQERGVCTFVGDGACGEREDEPIDGFLC